MPDITDYDMVSGDDDIGSTTIDLENRYISNHRATVGLPAMYYDKGKYPWNQSKKPMEILQEKCGKKADYQNGVLSIGENSYTIENFEDVCLEKDRLASHVLKLV